jgi:hypothetical protein
VRTGLRLFHNHLTVDLVASLFEFGSEPFVRLRESIWLDAFREAGAFAFPPLPELEISLDTSVPSANQAARRIAKLVIGE